MLGFDAISTQPISALPISALPPASPFVPEELAGPRRVWSIIAHQHQASVNLALTTQVLSYVLRAGTSHRARTIVQRAAWESPNLLLTLLLAAPASPFKATDWTAAKLQQYARRDPAFINLLLSTLQPAGLMGRGLDDRPRLISLQKNTWESVNLLLSTLSEPAVPFADRGDALRRVIQIARRLDGENQNLLNTLFALAPALTPFVSADWLRAQCSTPERPDRADPSSTVNLALTTQVTTYMSRGAVYLAHRKAAQQRDVDSLNLLNTLFAGAPAAVPFIPAEWVPQRLVMARRDADITPAPLKQSPFVSVEWTPVRSVFVRRDADITPMLIPQVPFVSKDWTSPTLTPRAARASVVDAISLALTSPTPSPFVSYDWVRPAVSRLTSARPVTDPNVPLSSVPVDAPLISVDWLRAVYAKPETRDHALDNRLLMGTLPLPEKPLISYDWLRTNPNAASSRREEGLINTLTLGSVASPANPFTPAEWQKIARGVTAQLHEMGRSYALWHQQPFVATDYGRRQLDRVGRQVEWVVNRLLNRRHPFSAVEWGRFQRPTVGRELDRSRNQALYVALFSTKPFASYDWVTPRQIRSRYTPYPDPNLLLSALFYASLAPPVGQFLDAPLHALTLDAAAYLASLEGQATLAALTAQASITSLDAQASLAALEATRIDPTIMSRGIHGH